MLILTLKTDNPIAEIGLFQDSQKLNYTTWEAHRQLAETIHRKIEDVSKVQGRSLKDIQGIVIFQGPGSFTGLRIGMSLVNALAYSLKIPVIVSKDGDWIESGIKKLLHGQADKIALPEYGAPVHITKELK